jgi:hypothetical protein
MLSCRTRCRRDRSRSWSIVLLIAGAWLALLGAEIGHAGEQAPAQLPARKLIEFGWDEPDTAFLRHHINEMEQTPFDGCVFHILSTDSQGRREDFQWLAWGRRRFTEAELKPALDDLKATAFGRFRHNFLRFNTAPGAIDWFDDHDAILNNARLAATIAREGRCAGLLFDVEEYQGGLFTYAQQRDAKTRSWDDYAAQARRRGREVMRAFQDGFPGLTVFLTFGHSLPRHLSGMGKTTLAECRYGLLAPFLDGLVDEAQGGTRLVDGFELSYGYRAKEQFDAGYRLMKEGVRPIVADPDRYARVVSAGFGLWMDHDWRKNGWDVDDPSKNHFTPSSFEASLRWALERSDQYVWIYTETPRWWSDEGKRIKLSAAYEEAIRRAARRPVVE